MRRVLAIIVTILLFVGAGYYFVATHSNPNPETDRSEVVNQPQSKTGKTTKTGIVTKVSGKYFLSELGSQQTLPIDSYSLDLEQYVGKDVTVTGEYSGDELFVSEVE